MVLHHNVDQKTGKKKKLEGKCGKKLRLLVGHEYRKGTISGGNTSREVSKKEERPRSGD